MNRGIRNRLVIAGILLIILLIVLFFIFHSHKQETYGYSPSYFNRPKPEYTMTFNYTNGFVDVYLIKFKSKDFMDYKT